MTRILPAIALALPLALTGPAQGAAPQSPPDLRGTLGREGGAPVPRDQYGNPIPPPQLTEAEREAARRELAARAEKARTEELKRQAAEEIRMAEERRAAERLEEEKRFHDKVMTAIYIGLAMLGLLVARSFFKRSQ